MPVFKLLSCDGSVGALQLAARAARFGLRAKSDESINDSIGASGKPTRLQEAWAVVVECSRRFQMEGVQSLDSSQPGMMNGMILIGLTSLWKSRLCSSSCLQARTPRETYLLRSHTLNSSRFSEFRSRLLGEEEPPNMTDATRSVSSGLRSFTRVKPPKPPFQVDIIAFLR